MKAKHLCSTKFCRNKRGKDHKICSKCRLRKWRKENPIKAILAHLKWSAKKRHIPFSLTLSQLKDLLFGESYQKDKGLLAQNLTIDRKDSTEGYHIDNLQVITRLENTYKENYERKHPF